MEFQSQFMPVKGPANTSKMLHVTLPMKLYNQRSSDLI